MFGLVGFSAFAHLVALSALSCGQQPSDILQTTSSSFQSGVVLVDGL